MRHHKKGRKLKKGSAQNKELLRGLACSLIKNGKIKTTTARAKELRPYVETLVTRARVSSLAGRRLLVSRLKNEDIVKKLLKEIAPQYAKRPGGYTRIVKIGTRDGDAAQEAIIQFV